MIPGPHPFESLETALLRIAVNPPAALLEQLRDGPRGLLRSVHRILPDDDGIALLVIDQFEELFTSTVSDADRDLFLRALAAAAIEPATPLRVVLTLRADFYDRPLRHPDFAPIIKESTVAISPLAAHELEQAIVTPAAQVGVAFEPGLVADIVAEVNQQPGALPLMQYALTNAFEHSDRTTITAADYRAIGGLTGALAQRAETIWQNASPDEQIATRRLFGRLVTLGEGREDTRRRVLQTELDDDPATASMIERYGVARLLAFDHDPQHASQRSRSLTRRSCASGHVCANGSTKTASCCASNATSRLRRPDGSTTTGTAASSTAEAASLRPRLCSPIRSASTRSRPSSSPPVSNNVPSKRPRNTDAPGDACT